MTGAKKKGRVAKAVAIAAVVLAAVATASVAMYRDVNLHAEQRLIDTALNAGFAEKQARVEGAVVNYAEGPDNGPALLLVHGQGMEWEDYASVLPDLSKRYHVFAVDCFGHGKSEHDPALYTCKTNGSALIEFARDVIGGPYAVSGHSSGGIIAAYIAANDPDNVTTCIFEDPPLFRVTPEEAQEGAGTFAWHDGYTVAHSFLQQDDVTDYAAWYAAHSYLFGLFGGMQPMLADQTAKWRATHPGEHVVNAWVPRAWTRGMYFMDDYDPRFGEAFYDGSWMAGIDQVAMLEAIACPVSYIKATTRYGDDGVLYAATTDDDAARVQKCLAKCSYIEIDSGHDIHVEHPDAFVKAVDSAGAGGAGASAAGAEMAGAAGGGATLSGRVAAGKIATNLGFGAKQPPSCSRSNVCRGFSKRWDK